MKTNSLSAWILAVRPYSLGASVIPVAVGSAMAWSDGGFRPAVAVLCLLFAVLTQCTANLVNDLWDFLRGADQPDRLGPDRAFAKGYITMPAMKAGIACFTLAACIAGCGLLFYGGWELILVGAACILFAYLYTAGPWPLAYHGLGDVAVVAFFGVVPACFTYWIQTGAWTPQITAAAIACGLVIDTMLWINNFRDRNEDARCGKRTIVVCLGERVGRWGYLVLGIAALALCLSLWIFGGRLWAGLLPLLYLPPFVAAWRKMIRIDHGDALNVCLGETARNMQLFGLLLTIGILLG
ncbi:MAG: 1,4-dihydroxy-2-naphthoate octaprenyltransferase [Alistipes sp.]|nr:1,4-dihydroxy-2-naphthoate octaprenyltransferase [Alistipes sp.]